MHLRGERIEADAVLERHLVRGRGRGRVRVRVRRLTFLEGHLTRVTGWAVGEAETGGEAEAEGGGGGYGAGLL